MARKKSGSDELLAPDAFQQQGVGWSSWFEKNIRLVLIGIAVVLVLVVGTEFLVSQSARSASTTTTQFGAALDAFREATDPSLAETATTTEVIDRAVDNAREKFRALSENGAGGPARVALLYQADLAARDEDPSAAAGLYVAYLEKAPADDPLRFIALEGAGYAYEALEAWDEALQYFGELEEIPFYEHWSLKHQARILAARGDRAEAAEVLRRLLDDDPSPFLKHHAENQLKLLN